MRMSIIFMVGAIVFLQGCETVKGTATGLKKDTENTFTNVKGFAQSLIEVDNRMQKNWW